jgi:hypothetical protein
MVIRAGAKALVGKGGGSIPVAYAFFYLAALVGEGGGSIPVAFFLLGRDFV